MECVRAVIYELDVRIHQRLLQICQREAGRLACILPRAFPVYTPVRYASCPCHCNSGINIQYWRGINGKRSLTVAWCVAKLLEPPLSVELTREEAFSSRLFEMIVLTW